MASIKETAELPNSNIPRGASVNLAAPRALERATSRGAPSLRDPAARRAQGRGVAAPDRESEGKRANRSAINDNRGRRPIAGRARAAAGEGAKSGVSPGVAD